MPLYTQVLEAQLLVQPGGSIQLQVQWLDAPPTERLEGSCGGCAHLTGGEESPPYHYGALLARAFAEPLAVPELRVRQRTAAAAGCDRSQGHCVDESICDLVCCLTVELDVEKWRWWSRSRRCKSPPAF